jgi:uncharacterized membrane protein
MQLLSRALASHLVPARHHVAAALKRLHGHPSDRRGRSGGFGRLPFVVAHVVWSGGWIAINMTRLRFDPFPFSLLTMIVSLDAILLSALLLMSQNRQMHDADRRAHLDLQVNLLAEQELTAILRVLMRLAQPAQIDIADEMLELKPLLRSTNVNELADLVQRNLEPERGPAP